MRQPGAQLAAYTHGVRAHARVPGTAHTMLRTCRSAHRQVETGHVPLGQSDIARLIGKVRGMPSRQGRRGLGKQGGLARRLYSVPGRSLRLAIGLAATHNPPLPPARALTACRCSSSGEAPTQYAGAVVSWPGLVAAAANCLAARGVMPCRHAALTGDAAPFSCAPATPSSHTMRHTCPHTHSAAVNLLSSVLDRPEYFWRAPDSLGAVYDR